MKANYIDGFLLVIPKKNVAAYKKMAREGAAAWKKFGALDYKECMGEDLKPKGEKGMMPMSFMKIADAKPSDTLWFSYITFKNKKHRDAVNKKVMAYFDKKYANANPEEMPMDPRRMAVGGFSVQVG